MSTPATSDTRSAIDAARDDCDDAYDAAYAAYVAAIAKAAYADRYTAYDAYVVAIDDAVGVYATAIADADAIA